MGGLQWRARGIVQSETGGREPHPPWESPEYPWRWPAEHPHRLLDLPAVDVPVQNTATHHELFLGEEEISDVNLSTFYVFDHENDATLKDGVKTAYWRGYRCGCARACRCGWRACGGCGVAAVAALAGDVAAGARRD
jgi:hypothetical protein